MRRLLSSMVLILGFLGLWGSLEHLDAQTITAEESQKVAAARTLISEVEKEQESQAESFAGLLELRERIEPARDTLRQIVNMLKHRLRAESAQLS